MEPDFVPSSNTHRSGFVVKISTVALQLNWQAHKTEGTAAIMSAGWDDVAAEIAGEGKEEIFGEDAVPDVPRMVECADAFRLIGSGS